MRVWGSIVNRRAGPATGLVRRFVGSLSICLCINAGAQDAGAIRGWYDRAISCIDHDDLPALRTFSDSLSGSNGLDDQSRAFAGILRAMVLRKSGKAGQAYHALDSVRLDPEQGNIIVRYFFMTERARALKALMIFPEASNATDHAIHLTRAFGMPSEEARCLILAAEIHRKQSEYEKSLSELIAAEKLVEGLADKRLLSSIELDRGNVLYDQERYPEALERYRRSYDLAGQYEMRADLGNALFNVASVTSEIDGPEASLKIFERALPKQDDPEFEADVRENMAIMLNDLGRSGQAREQIENAIGIRRHLSDTSGVVGCGFVMANILWSQGKADSAIATLARVITSSRALGALEDLVQAEDHMSRYLRDQGRLREAIEHMSAYRTLSDSLNEIKKGETINRLEIQYETEKKEQALKVKDLELAEANAAKRSKEIQSYWLLGAAIVLLLLLGLVFRNSQHLRKLRTQEQVLHERRITDLLQQQEIRALDAMMQGQEKERERIAKDLHDRLGSMLSAIKLQFSALEARMTRMEAEQKDQYRHVFNLLDEAVSEVRRISHDMMRGVITQFGLERALEDLRSSIEAPGTLQVELSTFGLEGRLEPKLEIAVYRMVQEMMSNVLKHARADHITIQITRSAAALNVIVEDNGRGFDPQSATEGMGMGNIRARAAEFKGSVNVDTQPQRGTSISIDIPLA